MSGFSCGIYVYKTKKNTTIMYNKLRKLKTA